MDIAYFVSVGLALVCMNLVSMDFHVRTVWIFLSLCGQDLACMDTT